MQSKSSHFHVNWVSAAFLIWAALTILSSGADRKPEGSIKSPESGDKVVSGKFEVEGRTRYLPRDWRVYFFTQESRSRVKEGLKANNWPHGPLEPNRRFEQKGLIGGKPVGKLWLYLYAVPPEVGKKIDEWRKKRKDYQEKFGHVGAPTMEREVLFKTSVLLSEVEIEIVPPEK